MNLPHFPAELIDGCINKFQMRKWMKQKGVRCPNFAQANDLQQAVNSIEEIGCPVVIKPKIGGASYGATLIRNKEEIKIFFDHVDIFWKPRSFIIEEYLDGKEISVETVTFETPRHVALFEKPQDLSGPYFLEDTFITPSQYNQDIVEESYNAVSEMINKLGMRNCITHTELRFTKNGPVVIEFGLRPIGYPGPVCVKSTTGIDLIQIMGGLAVGNKSFITVDKTYQYSGWRYITVKKEGILKEIKGIDSISNIPGVQSFHLWASQGEQILLPPRGFNYIKGFVAVGGCSFEEVKSRLDYADSLLQFTYQ